MHLRSLLEPLNLILLQVIDAYCAAAALLPRDSLTVDQFYTLLVELALPLIIARRRPISTITDHMLPLEATHSSHSVRSW